MSRKKGEWIMNSEKGLYNYKSSLSFVVNGFRVQNLKLIPWKVHLNPITHAN